MKVIGVQFSSAVKIYDFKPVMSKVSLNDWVLVDTAQGKEVGRVVYINKEISDKEDEVREIIRLADEKDLSRQKRMIDEGGLLYPVFCKFAKKFNLELKPVKTELSFDGEKLVCYFTADNRVDFRELIKDLSREVKRGVIMRQIGPRDEAKILDGYGICGEQICCKRFLTKMDSVTMEMARDQFENNINATKVTGSCGRLMCCLAFEVGQKRLKK